MTTSDTQGLLINPFRRFMDHTKKHYLIVHIAADALGKLDQEAGILRALEDRLEIVGTEQLIREEKQHGFPTLYGTATIATWAGLEALVKDVLVNWLWQIPTSVDKDRVSKIKIPLAEYMTLDGQGQAARLADEIERGSDAANKLGINRFELLLEPLGMSGEVDPETRANLFEMGQVRNILLHQAGVADERFIHHCGQFDQWTACKVDDEVKVGWSAYTRYVMAAMSYTGVLLNRATRRYKELTGQTAAGSGEAQGQDATKPRAERRPEGSK